MSKEITVKDFTDNPITGETAEQVYKKWVENKDKKQEREITTEDYLMDMDYRISKLELGLGLEE